MARSFGLVEVKLTEAEYFLQRMSGAGTHSREARYYFSAFFFASRSVTFVLKACLNDVEGFVVSYGEALSSIKADPSPATSWSFGTRRRKQARIRSTE